MDDIDVKIANFHKNLDEWISGHNINYGMDNSQDLAKRVGEIMNWTEDKVKQLSHMECQAAIFSLNKYLTYMNSMLAREKSVKQWAEQGILYMITGYEFDKFVKWEEKYYITIRLHKESGAKLHKLKTVSESRILETEATVKGVELAIKILENVGKGKLYERS